MLYTLFLALISFQSSVPDGYQECYGDEYVTVFSRIGDVCDRIPVYGNLESFGVLEGTPVILVFTRKWVLAQFTCSMTGPFESNTLPRLRSLDFDLDGDIDLRDYTLIEASNGRPN